MKVKRVKKMGMKGAPDDGSEQDSKAAKVRRGKSVEQIYQKKTPIEHILLRPDTYVGSVEKQEDTVWVWNGEIGKMEQQDISYVPALYKIFDEILVNAADNLQRPNSGTTEIRVEIDPKHKRIKVWNNGKGIPIQIHKKHKVFVPELVFGHLLTSDNYDDSEKKVTGGRNGFGAKLTNVFSNRFHIETAGRGKKYVQEWVSNMGRKGKPEVKSYSGQEYTSVEFWPDLPKFGMKDLEEDTVALMRRRVYDLAGTTSDRCTVYLDGKKIPIKKFEDYCSLYHSGAGHAYARIGRRWEVLVARSDGDGFEQCSFVNAITTPKGGTHVQYVTDQLVDVIASKASKQAGKGTEIRRVVVKNNLWVFINCLIENPAFSSQTKEQMTLKAASFGSTCVLPRAFIDAFLEKTDLINVVINDAQMKMMNQMDRSTKSGGKGKHVLGVPKLEDANEAGGKFAKQCSLILTEGDSAKALAVAGLAVIGRDKFGVFPLRGKLLNVRDVTQKQVAENREIMNVVKILGLSFGTKDLSKMRYGSVMIMADQDHDGSHIKGLLINFFHYWWPELLKDGGFVKEFVTPIVKASKAGEVKTFFTQTEYELWRKKNDGAPGWHIKYYKGLGTSTSAEAKEYFSAMATHSLDFEWHSKDGELIDMAFNKGRADDRKIWMNKYEEGTHVDHSQPKITYGDFVNLELVQFSKYSVMRAVPSLMDGLKPTQRKVLFACFKKNLRSDIKVAQFAGYIGEHAAYHHGEQSLGTTIVSMAQNFVGSNNINLLVPSGQFGTRAVGGSDSASTRYIYTRMSPLTRLIYHPHDDPVLTYLEEDGQQIEPYWYAPVIPMVLVNGATGIGTGWSTEVPNYDPREMIENLRRYIKRRPMKDMAPWYWGFTGKIKRSGRGTYSSVGVWNEKGHRRSTIKSALKDPSLLTPKEIAQAGKASFKEARKLGYHKKLKDITETHEFKKMINGPARALEALKAADGGMREAKKSLLETLDGSEVVARRKKGDSDERIIEITELPIRKWTQDYKEFLMGMLPESEKKTKITIQDLREYHTEHRVHFDLKMTDKEMGAFKEQGGVENALRLIGSINETNMVLFDSDGHIKKYKTVVEIMQEFAKVRLKYYDIRKKYLVHKLTLERDLLSNRARFILLIIKKKLTISNRKKADVVKDLARLKFQKFGDTRPPRTGFEYLLIMQIASLTKERFEELLRMSKEKAKELELVKRTSIQAMWNTDLDRLEEAINDLYKLPEDEAGKGKKRKGSRSVEGGKGKRRKIGRFRPRRGRGRAGGGDADEVEKEGGKDDESEDDREDPMDNPFSDVMRWTAGKLMQTKTQAKSSLPRSGRTKSRARMAMREGRR